MGLDSVARRPYNEGKMIRGLFPVLAALIFPFALLLFVAEAFSAALALLARASPPGRVPVRSRPPIPSAGRSPPLFA